MTQPYQPQQPQPVYVQQQYVPVRPMKETGIAYLWLLASVFGICGLQHFYLGKTGRGLLWLFTLGLLGVGVLVDLFTLPAQTRQVNAQRAVGLR
ncbi:NINE protein [Cellulomonas endometrii]|uniref:NINE protein n=1 Tax=Cellulomonas endometrii TaxID=3036301 RepID=UPI0024ADC38A|nr:NINE protein [Cellulomonas endometrii]